MKIAYFDCPSGIAGNMIVGALIDAGIEVEYLVKELQKLQTSNFKLQNKYQLQITKDKKHGIQGTYFNVIVKNDLPRRTLPEVLAIIRHSQLSKYVKRCSARIFRRLARAEAKVHGVAVNKVHFHDVGAIDAIVDIVGACIGFEKLGIGKICCSPLPHGKGFIHHAHGKLPNPAPATVELLKCIPTYGKNIHAELVTPTGAAIISTLAESFGDIPRLKVAAIGYGAGSFELPIPNLLRLFIGEEEFPAEKDAILQIEANIDDMHPKHYDRAIAKMMKAGALDASIYPIRMKKGRNAIKLEVLCEPEDKEKVLNSIFTETTTIGTRVYLVKREKLKREIRRGKKISSLGDKIVRIKAESAPPAARRPL
jgi:uncharacterized protein (TIGR00299 family) protein